MRKLLTTSTLILLVTHCGERAEPEQAARPVASTTSAPAPAPSGPVIIRDAGGAQIMSVAENDLVIDIALAEGGQLRGEPRDSGKRKYTLDGGSVIYEVKPGDDNGFKLRTADGKLRWKVKVTAEKIKISDNEQNDRPFELKVRDGDRVKVVAPGDRELGNVRFDSATKKTEIENAAGKTLFRVEDPKPSGSYGVLLLDIPANERAILLAEILARGR